MILDLALTQVQQQLLNIVQIAEVTLLLGLLQSQAILLLQFI